MDTPAVGDLSLRDELRLHARYIRDTLVPILSRQYKLTHSDNVLLRSIFKKLDSTHITLPLLRYSRMEKALMVIAATGASTWPMEVAAQAESLIQKWEDELGPLKNLRADLYGPGGRLEGVRKITDGRKGSLYEKDDELKSAWSVNVTDPFRSHGYGSLGFEVGDWWLKPAAAYRDGIIDKTAHAITADNNGAYAIVVNGSRELNLQPNGTFAYHAALDDPGAFKLTKTMTSDTGKIVRVLRSWKLRSKLAPKAGLRYDGLYRIESFGIKLLPPDSWHKTFTLSRMPNQPPITTALAYPMSDQLDDWRDYQHLKRIDRGEDFAMLREILREPTINVNNELGGEDMARQDSGYFSRRSSKISSRINSVPNTMSEGKIGVASTAQSRINSLSRSLPDEVDEIDFAAVAEDTPSSPESEPRIVHTADMSSVSCSMQESTGLIMPDRESDSTSDLEPRHVNRTTSFAPSEASAESTKETDHEETHPLESQRDWTSGWGIWRSSSTGLDGIEESEFVDWASNREGGDEEDEAVSPDEAAPRSDELSVRSGALKTRVDFVDCGEEAARRRWFVVGSE